MKKILILCFLVISFSPLFSNSFSDSFSDSKAEFERIAIENEIYDWDYDYVETSNNLKLITAKIYVKPFYKREEINLIAIHFAPVVNAIDKDIGFTLQILKKYSIEFMSGNSIEIEQKVENLRLKLQEILEEGDFYINYEISNEITYINIYYNPHIDMDLDSVVSAGLN